MEDAGQNTYITEQTWKSIYKELYNFDIIASF